MIVVLKIEIKMALKFPMGNVFFFHSQSSAFCRIGPYLVYWLVDAGTLLDTFFLAEIQPSFVYNLSYVTARTNLK